MFVTTNAAKCTEYTRVTIGLLGYRVQEIENSIDELPLIRGIILYSIAR
jgi:hypothetical protein